MTMRSWVRNVFTRPVTRTIRKAPPRSRPALEVLEDRWVPSTILVNNSTDAHVPGQISLREAIAQANGASEATTIEFAPSVLAITLQGNTGGDNGLELTNTNYAVTIQGPTDFQVIVQASGQTGTDHINHIFFIDKGVNATISNLRIVDGFDENPADGGGGMLNYGTVSLTNCNFNRNVAFNGGGLFNAGSASLTECIFSDNTVVYGGLSNDVGGAIFNGYSAAASYGPGTMTLRDCTISGNYANQNGGGLYNDKQSTVYLSNCTLSDNTAKTGDGGGLYNKGKAYLSDNCTLSGNTAGNLGGGLYNNGSGDSDHAKVNLTNCTISGNTAYRGGGLYNNLFGDANLTECTLKDNKTSGGGGGLFNASGTAILNKCTVSGNTASGNGGGLSNSEVSYERPGTLNVNKCTVSGNTTSGSGGGLYNSGMASLTNSTFSSDTASNYGGGLYNERYYGTVNLTNCTFSTNTAGSGYYGGGLYNGYKAALVSCTFSDNMASYGGGLYNNYSVSLINTIVAGNTAVNGGPDVYNDSSLTSLGYNLIGKTDGSSGWVKTDLTGTIAKPLNPKLAPLADNGGPTQTMALLPGSRANGKGTRVLGVTTDQRGSPLDTPKPDIGAFQT